MLESQIHSIKPKLVCLAETWLNEEKNAYFKIEGFHKVTDSFRQNKKGGGVAIFKSVENTVKASPLSMIKSLSLENIIECCGIIVCYEKFKFVLLNVYRPPCKTSFLQFIEVLEDILSCIQGKHGELPLVLCGDLNVDHLDNKWEKEYLKDVLQSNNLHITFEQCTRIDGNSGRLSQLDYFITDIGESSYFVEVLPSLLSDHSLIVFRLNVKMYNNRKTVEKRKINHASLDLFGACC